MGCISRLYICLYPKFEGRTCPHAYSFFPSGTVGLAVFLALPARRRSMSTSFRELGGSTVLSFPGAPPLKVSKLAQGLADDGEACQAMLRVAARMGGLVQMDKTTRACGGDTKG
jgi:hypothetical protein